MSSSLSAVLLSIVTTTHAVEPPRPLDGLPYLGGAAVSRDDRAAARALEEGGTLRERLEVRWRARDLGPGALLALARREPVLAAEASSPLATAALDLLRELPEALLDDVIAGNERVVPWSSPRDDSFARALDVKPLASLTVRRVQDGIGVYLGSRGTVVADDPASAPPERLKALARRLRQTGYEGWRAHRRGALVVHTERAPAPALTRRMERALERIVDRTGIDPEIEDVHVWVHRSVRHLLRRGQHVNHAVPAERRIVWSRGATLGHETVHVVLQHAWGPGGDAEEGIATLLSDRFALGPLTPVAPRWTPRRMRRRMGELVPWRQVEQAGEVHRYLQMAALAGAVEARHGAHGLRALWIAQDPLHTAEELLGEDWPAAVDRWLAAP